MLPAHSIILPQSIFGFSFSAETHDHSKGTRHSKNKYFPSHNQFPPIHQFCIISVFATNYCMPRSWLWKPNQFPPIHHRSLISDYMSSQADAQVKQPDFVYTQTTWSNSPKATSGSLLYMLTMIFISCRHTRWYWLGCGRSEGVQLWSAGCCRGYIRASLWILTILFLGETSNPWI